MIANQIFYSLSEVIARLENTFIYHYGVQRGRNRRAGGLSPAVSSSSIAEELGEEERWLKSLTLPFGEGGPSKTVGEVTTR